MTILLQMLTMRSAVRLSYNSSLEMELKQLLVDSKLIAFRQLSASHVGNEPWISTQKQSVIWNQLFDMVRKAAVQGLMPVVLIDLDLTTLLAPQKSRDVLTELASQADNLAPWRDPQMVR